MPELFYSDSAHRAGFGRFMRFRGRFLAGRLGDAGIIHPETVRSDSGASGAADASIWIHFDGHMVNIKD